MPNDEVKWGEWSRHCDVALGYFSWWFHICRSDPWLVESVDAEPLHKGLTAYTVGTEGGLYSPSDETLGELLWVILDHPGIRHWRFDARRRWYWWLENPVGRKWDCGTFHHRTQNHTKFKLISCLFLKFPFNTFGPQLTSGNWNCGRWNNE